MIASQPPDGTPHGSSPPPRWAFGGPWGSLALTFALPATVFYLWICLVHNDGHLLLPRTGEEWRRLFSLVPAPSLTAVLLYAGWFGMQVLFQLFMPGKIEEGTPLGDGSRLGYKMNGNASFVASLVVVVGLAALGAISPTVFYDRYGELVSTVTLFTLAYSGFLYRHGRRHGQGERVHGSLLHDFFMGSSLNPRTGPFDHKLFCEARPGLILWVLGNLSLAAKQYQLHGTVTTPMILVCLFQLWYVADYHRHEAAILTTWDIKHENFGYMLCFGDLVWVPFTYTFQAIYLVNHTHDLTWWATALMVLLNFGGFIIFRFSNLQKYRFKLDPTRPVWGRPPQVIRTARGTPLLASGWWGLARHINYLGDLMMGLAWCLTCLFGAIVPYFYIIYFTILLVFRERRDQRMCREKYGADWDRYTEKVRWRILPGVY